MHVLITGANGFVGRHLIRELVSAGHRVTGQVEPDGDHLDGLPCLEADIRDAERLTRMVTETVPDACIHLAGLAHVPTAWENPTLAVEVNVNGTLNLLEAFRTQAPTARILVITSSEVYGKNVQEEIITEDTPLSPSSIYGMTKAAADQAARMYTPQYGMEILVARPENHFGPGQSPQFVSSAFARQLAKQVLSGQTKTLKVGNLESTRSFTDVRDVVKAYRLLLEHGIAGEAYNVASNQQVKIGVLLERLMDAAGVHPDTTTHPDYFRPTDHSPAYDTGKLEQATGWQPTYALEQTLQDVFNDTLHRLQVDADS